MNVEMGFIIISTLGNMGIHVKYTAHNVPGLGKFEEMEKSERLLRTVSRGG